MVIGGINVLAVLVATVISMVLGFIWYREAVFGKQWMASTGRTEVSGGAPAMYVLTAIFALLQATILAVIVALAGAATLVAGATLGFLAWLGFVATTQGVDALFNARKMSFYAISTGYHPGGVRDHRRTAGSVALTAWDVRQPERDPLAWYADA